MLPLIQPRRLEAIQSECHGSLVFRAQLTAHHGPRGLFNRAAPRAGSPSLGCCTRLFLPRCATWHLFLLNFSSFLLAHALSLSRSCWTATLPTIVLTRPAAITSFVSLVNMMNMHLVTSSKSLIKMLLNRAVPGKTPALLHSFLASR